MTLAGVAELQWSSKSGHSPVLHGMGLAGMAELQWSSQSRHSPGSWIFMCSMPPRKGISPNTTSSITSLPSTTTTGFAFFQAFGVQSVNTSAIVDVLDNYPTIRGPIRCVHASQLNHWSFFLESACTLIQVHTIENGTTGNYEESKQMDVS